MIITHYAHRLPADYDMERIRVRERGPLWDGVPDLYFKGFLVRQRGLFGASANQYTSLYLWRRAEGFADFLVSDRFNGVIESFGRPEVEIRTVLDARKGHGSVARFAMIEEQSLAKDVDLATTFASEVAGNGERAACPHTVAAVVGIDTQRWTITRILLSESEPHQDDGATIYEIAYVARPGLDALAG